MNAGLIFVWDGIAGTVLRIVDHCNQISEGERIMSSKSPKIYSNGSKRSSSCDLCSMHGLIATVTAGICGGAIAIKHRLLPSLPLNHQVTSRASMHVQYNLTALM